MSFLFSELEIKSVRFKNRIVVSPMCQYSSVDGFLTDWHLVHLGSRAIGGAALVIQEATAVSPEGRISYGDAGIWKDEHIPFLKKITSFIHEHGSVAGIQLSHAGRKASTDFPWNGGGQLIAGENSWLPVAPSAVPFKEGDRPPLALDAEGIKQVIGDFRDAAKRALAAGYQVIEIHAAHGYLINQFLSPTSNKRTDEYGGSFENRSRLLLEILEAVQEVWPADLPLFVRISATEWVQDGWDLADSIKLAGILKDKGVDLIDSSSGGNSASQKIPVGPGYQVPLANEIREKTGIRTGAVGLITSATQAEEVLQQGKADMVFLAREMLRDPYFPLHAAAELGAELSWPVQYERAKPRKVS
ncbi:MAG: NADPH dehydrogenase NamA [Chitinophagaceae bacterium]|nr:MAG: NADPH dehydrogenase NamA [Chitinophagaceae bacterium]